MHYLYFYRTLILDHRSPPYSNIFDLGTTPMHRVPVPRIPGIDTLGPQPPRNTPPPHPTPGPRPSDRTTYPEIPFFGRACGAHLGTILKKQSDMFALRKHVLQYKDEYQNHCEFMIQEACHVRPCPDLLSRASPFPRSPLLLNC